MIEKYTTPIIDKILEFKHYLSSSKSQLLEYISYANVKYINLIININWQKMVSEQDFYKIKKLFDEHANHGLVQTQPIHSPLHPLSFFWPIS